MDHVIFLPKGVIVAWSGTNVPQGWQLCDGTNGTPDLRGRFILGAGQGPGLTGRNMGESGGEETHLLTVQEMPPHNHTFGVGGGGGWSGSGGETDDGYSCNPCSFLEYTSSTGVIVLIITCHHILCKLTS